MHDIAALSRQDLENSLTRLAAHINAATYRFLVLIAEFDRREAWGGEGVKSSAHWLNWKCGISLGAAREKVRVAKALEELPVVSASFARGEISFSKVRALTRVATPDCEDYLLMIARHGTASHLERLVQGYRRVERDEEEFHNANRQFANRYLSYYYDTQGSLIISARLPPEQGAALVKSIEAARDVLRNERKDVPAGTSFQEPFDAERADALALMAESFQAGEITTRNGGDRCQVVIHVDEQVLKSPQSPGRCECEAGPALAPETARRLACDASLVRVVEDENGEPLSVGRKTRAIPPALRRALQIRDRHCSFPGCVSRQGLDAHHIRHWADGGETKTENLSLICGFHHRLIHEGGFQLSRESDGTLTFMTPKGNRIYHYLEPVTSDTHLEVLNQQTGLDIDHETAIPNWHFGGMDLHMAVSGLYDLIKRT